jgi:hypothetical protein
LYCLQASAATFLVTNINDTGAGSLRQAIVDANATPGFDTISFDTAGVFATPQTITLTSGELLITDSVSINGTGANRLTVQRSTAGGTPAFRIFNISSGSADVTIDGLTVMNGHIVASSLGGGGISNDGTLTVTNSTISGNSATWQRQLHHPRRRHQQ